MDYFEMAKDIVRTDAARVEEEARARGEAERLRRQRAEDGAFVAIVAIANAKAMMDAIKNPPTDMRRLRILGQEVMDLYMPEMSTPEGRAAMANIRVALDQLLRVIDAEAGAL